MPGVGANCAWWCRRLLFTTRSRKETHHIRQCQPYSEREACKACGECDFEGQESSLAHAGTCRAALRSLGLPLPSCRVWQRRLFGVCVLHLPAFSARQLSWYGLPCEPWQEIKQELKETECPRGQEVRVHSESRFFRLFAESFTS